MKNKMGCARGEHFRSINWRIIRYWKSYTYGISHLWWSTASSNMPSHELVNKHPDPGCNSSWDELCYRKQQKRNQTYLQCLSTALPDDITTSQKQQQQQAVCSGSSSLQATGKYRADRADKSTSATQICGAAVDESCVVNTPYSMIINSSFLSFYFESD